MNQPKTPEGAQAWEVFKACSGQVRAAGMGQPYALDYGAVITFADRMGIEGDLFIELLPVIETMIVRSYRKEP